MENRWKCFLYLFIFLIISHSTFSLTPANILLSYLLSGFSKNSLVTLSPTHSEHLVLSPLPVPHSPSHTQRFSYLESFYARYEFSFTFNWKFCLLFSTFYDLTPTSAGRQQGKGNISNRGERTYKIKQTLRQSARKFGDGNRWGSNIIIISFDLPKQKILGIVQVLGGFLGIEVGKKRKQRAKFICI